MFAAIFWFVVKVAVMYGISVAIRGKVRLPKRAPAGLDSFDFPTAEEGRPIAVLFGKKRIQGPNVVWYGDFWAYRMYKKVKTSLFNTKRQTFGYMYFVGMHMITGYANADGVKQIWVGEKVVWPTANDPSVEQADGAALATINAISIFGGPYKEGGVSGVVDIMYGEASQAQNTYLVSKLGSDISAYRGLLSIVLNKVYVGTNAYIKPWSFLIKRTDKLVAGGAQWYIAKAKIGGDDLNPIHIIRECLTDFEFGLGTPVTDINDTNFQAAADILYTEGSGLSYTWDLSTPVEEFIGDILNTIEAMLYQNLSSGQWEIKLIREPTAGELSAAETFDEDTILEIEEFDRPAYGEIVNQVTINWNDRIYNKNRPCTVHDSTLIEKQGNAIIEKTFNYYGICSESIANDVANRELLLATSMLATIKMRCNRQMSHLKPGDIFKLTWSDLGITTMVVRIVEVNYGNLDNNEITLTCVEDVFSTVYTIYSDPADTGWTDPINDPADPTYKKLIEAPYWILCDDMGKDIVDDFDNDLAIMLCSAVKPTSDANEFKLLVRFDVASDFIDEGPGPFTPSATLVANLAKASADIEITLENIVDLDLVESSTYAMIGDEIVSILSTDVANSKITIARGVLDTKPNAHSLGARIWFLESNITAIHNDYSNGDTPGVKFLTRTGRGELLEGSAATETASAFDSRMIRPYLPGNLKINGVSYPQYLYGQPTLTWNHRDRTHQDQLRSLIKHIDATDYGPEAGTTYTLKIYNQDNYLLRTVTGLESVNTYTYTQVSEEADSPDGHVSHKLRFVFYSSRAGYDSYQEYDITLERPLYGTINAIASVTDSKLYINPRKLAGNPSSSATVTGDCVGTQELIGSVIGQSGATGNLTGTQKLAGDVSTSSGATGNLAGTQKLAGSVDSQAGSSGDVTEV